MWLSSSRPRPPLPHAPVVETVYFCVLLMSTNWRKSRKSDIMLSASSLDTSRVLSKNGQVVPPLYLVTQRQRLDQLQSVELHSVNQGHHSVKMGQDCLVLVVSRMRAKS